jgi:hypothetical protein
MPERARRRGAVSAIPHSLSRAARTLGGALLLLSCGGTDVSQSKDRTDAGAPPVAPMAPVSDAVWRDAGSERIWFGHQSVGGNILDGLRELGAGTSAPLHIVGSRTATDARPALYEFHIGENGRPETKMADFAAALAPLGDTASGVALFKYCFLDITPGTNVDALFAQHRATVRALQAQHPHLTFVHVTAPLTRDETGPKRLLKQLLGKPTTRDANRRRNAFNAMLRREFASEPIFDLARVESTRPDGARAAFTAGGDSVFTLAPEYTDDGGHLNAAGRRAAAAELVATLARVAKPGAEVARSTP